MGGQQGMLSLALGGRAPAGMNLGQAQQDGDGNIHHWAAFLVAGYFASRPIAGIRNPGGGNGVAIVNTIREYATQGQNKFMGWDDIPAGNIAARLGEALAIQETAGGLSPGAIRILYENSILP